MEKNILQSQIVSFFPPSRNDSMLVLFDIACEQALAIRAVVMSETDENSANDTVHLKLEQHIDFGDIIFNEIFATPFSGHAEWVELFNQSNTSFSLDSFQFIRGGPGFTKETAFELPSGLPILPPEGSVLICSDSSIFIDWPEISANPHCIVVVVGKTSLGLGNNGDLLRFMNPKGVTIDSVVYDASWHHPLLSNTSGRSLELINPAFRGHGASGWTTSPHPSGGTPGKRNASWIDINTVPSALGRVQCFPNPFSPDGDGFEDNAVITWELPIAVSSIRLRIYDAMGRCVRTLLNNSITNKKGSEIWDGLDDEGRRVRIGIYIVLVEALEAISNTTTVLKTTLVVATRL